MDADVRGARLGRRRGPVHVLATGSVSRSTAVDLDGRPSTGTEQWRQGLLSAEELRFQLEALAGPSRELPDLRAHELFEQRATARPDAIVAGPGDQVWTYRELNARANRLARVLLVRGPLREGVVAVVCERGPGWQASVHAVFKAGGVYLPVEPHFPADRTVELHVLAGGGHYFPGTRPEETARP